MASAPPTAAAAAAAAGTMAQQQAVPAVELPLGEAPAAAGRAAPAPGPAAAAAAAVQPAPVAPRQTAPTVAPTPTAAVPAAVPASAVALPAAQAPPAVALPAAVVALRRLADNGVVTAAAATAVEGLLLQITPYLTGPNAPALVRNRLGTVYGVLYCPVDWSYEQERAARCSGRHATVRVLHYGPGGPGQDRAAVCVRQLTPSRFNDLDRQAGTYDWRRSVYVLAGGFDLMGSYAVWKDFASWIGWE